MKKKSFLLYCDQYEIISDLSIEQQGYLLKAIYEYACNDVLIDFTDPILKVVFKMIKITLDRDAHKYEATCNRNKNNGLKGGRPKKPTRTHPNPKNPLGYSETHPNPKNPLEPDSDSDRDSDNERDSDRDKTIKEKYLDFVLLTKDEHNKLSERFGLEYTSSSIERLNNYIGSKGKKYKSHYHTILSWANKNGDTPLPVANKVVKTTAQLLEEALS